MLKPERTKSAQSLLTGKRKSTLKPPKIKRKNGLKELIVVTRRRLLVARVKVKKMKAKTRSSLGNNSKWKTLR